MLLNKDVEHAQLTKFQNFRKKRNLSSVGKYLQFSWEFPEYREDTIFLENIQIDSFLN